MADVQSADAIVNALDKCGLTEGDALSRKRRRYERLGNTIQDSLITRRKGKGVRRAPCGSRRRTLQAPVDQKDPLTKLRVFKDMKKSKSKGKGKMAMPARGKHTRTDSSSTEDHSVSDIEEVLEDDERMDLSDIEWYTRQDFDDFEKEPRTPVTKARFYDEEDDDLDMSEVELDVLASPMCISPSPQGTPRTAFQIPANPIVSIPELNSVPVCLYRPTADIIEEVYTHLGLSMSDHRGIKVLRDLLDTPSTGISKPKSSRYELGSSGIFPNRPTAAKDWAALSLTRKIIRRDRLAKTAIYRFTFRYPKEEVPARFLKWQTWNHPTLAEIKQGLRFKLDERVEEVEVESEVASSPSSPALVESELDDLEDVPEIDDILSVASELEEEEEASTVDMSEYAETEVAEEVNEAELTETESEIDDAEEDEQFFHALGLSGVPEYESPGRPIRESTRGAPIYSRLSRERDSDSPPNYAPRNYRDQSPTPPPPFNAQTDNDVIVLPHFSPLALVPTVLPQLLPAFESAAATRRVISPLPSSERRIRSTRAQRRVVSGEIVIAGAFAQQTSLQNRTPPTPTPAPRRAAADDSFQHALDMEEAETALELLEPELESSAEGPSGVIGWGASVVRSWWRR